MPHFHTRRFVLLAGLVIMAAAHPALAAAAPILADHPQNALWKIDGASATFSGGKTGFNGPTLVFDKSALLAKPVQLTCRTDSAQLSIRCGYTRIRLSFADLSHPQIIVLDAPGQAIRINNKTTDTVTGEWKRLIERGTKPTVELTFGRNAKKVSVQWLRVAPIGSAATTGGDGGESSAAAAPLDPLVLRDRIRRAVYPLHATLKDKSAQRAGLATVLSADGLVLMPLDLVNHSEQIDMVFGRSTVRVGLMKIDPLRNLALGKLDASSGIWRPVVQPLDLAPQDPAADQKIQIVEWSAGLGLTTAEHQVVAVEEFTGLPRDRQRVLRAPGQTRWIQTDENLSIYGGGTPAVNSAGQLVGLSYWTWPQRNAGSALLAVSELRQFMADLPSAGLRHDDVQTMLDKVELPASAFPRLTFTADQPPTALRRQLALVKNNAPCPLCKGRGQIHRSVVSGYEKTGGLKKPVEGTEMFVCPRCQGFSYNKIDVLGRMFGNLIEAIAHADPDAADYPRTAELVIRVLEEVGAINPIELRQAINQRSSDLIRDGKIGVGDALVFIGRPERLTQMRHVPDLHVVSLAPPSRSSQSIFSNPTDRRLRGPSVLVYRPKVLTRSRASVVMVGGIFAGYVAIDSKQRMPVLQGGFVAEVKESDDNALRRNTTTPSRRFTRPTTPTRPFGR